MSSNSSGLLFWTDIRIQISIWIQWRCFFFFFLKGYCFYLSVCVKHSSLFFLFPHLWVIVIPSLLVCLAKQIHRLAFSLRMFSNEDVTIGSWMVAMNVHHEDNRELCDPRCTPTSIAVWDIPKCSGNSTLNSYRFFLLHISNRANTFS